MMQLVLKFLSGGLVVLLAFMAAWGQCAACPLIVPQKACCSHSSGNCQMPSPKPQSTERPCPDQALAPTLHHDTQASIAQMVAPAPVTVSLETPAVIAAPAPDLLAKPNTGPPDLYLVNLALLV
jgi:hypothetical protein